MFRVTRDDCEMVAQSYGLSERKMQHLLDDFDANFSIPDWTDYVEVFIEDHIEQNSRENIELHMADLKREERSL